MDSCSSSPLPFCLCHIPYYPFPVIVNLFVWLCVQLLSLPVGCQLRRKRPHPPPRSRRVRLSPGPPPAHRRAPSAGVQAFPSGVIVAPEAPKGPGWGCRHRPPPAGVTYVGAHPSVGGLDRCSPPGPSSTWKTSLPRETRGRQWPGRGAGGGESDEVSSS